MGLSVIPKKKEAVIGTALLAIFFVGMNPPVVNVFNQATTVAGLSMLYLWLIVMSVFISAVLVWAAKEDAFALTEDQVPPELREQEGVLTAEERATEEASMSRSDR